MLDEHRKVCEREGKLDEAKQARRRLKQLRIMEESKRKEEVDENHVSANPTKVFGFSSVSWPAWKLRTEQRLSRCRTSGTM